MSLDRKFDQNLSEEIAPLVENHRASFLKDRRPTFDTQYFISKLKRAIICFSGRINSIKIRVQLVKYYKNSTKINKGNFIEQIKLCSAKKCFTFTKISHVHRVQHGKCFTAD